MFIHGKFFQTSTSNPTQNTASYGANFMRKAIVALSENVRLGWKTYKASVTKEIFLEHLKKNFVKLDQFGSLGEIVYSYETVKLTKVWAICANNFAG